MEQIVSFLLKALFLAHIVLSANIVSRVDPLVLTSQGLVRGVRSTEGDFSSFLGIPFAQVNASNPFGAALPAPDFEDTFEAYDGQITCPQTNSFSNAPTTLDCLRLNIYVPNQADSRNPLPVLVWIYGGGFFLGSAAQYSPLPLINQDIVLVTINYRVGAYGFMCLNTPEVPGNQGLKDQLAALRWINQNIAAFGGNPNLVTLAGQSAGAASVNLHMYSSNEQLFHRAILESGTTNVRLSPNDETAAIRLAEQIGFNAQDTGSALEFLSNSPTELVTGATEALGIFFGPCIERIVDDNSFITTNPLTATFTRTAIPTIIGVTSFELMGFGGMFSSSFRDGMERIFDFNEEELEKFTAIVQHFYAGDGEDSAALLTQLEQFDTDIVHSYPLEREITKFVEQGVGPVYSYVYEYVSENDAGIRETAMAPHAAELRYLFSYGQNGYGTFNDEEQEISDRICTLWGDFVKHGNPTPASSALLPWPTVSGDERPYLVIGVEPRVENRFQHANSAFWELFYKAYGDRDRMMDY